MMASIEATLKDVIARLDREIRDLAERKGKKHVRPKPFPPATEEEIARYEEYLGLKLPPSYRAFLKLHNGYDYLAYPGHMLSIQAVMPRGKWHKKIKDWKTTTAKYGSGEVLDGIVIANLDGPNNWTFLDPNKPTEGGEFAVVRWLSGDSDDYLDLVAFLENRIGLCRRIAAGPPPSDDDDE
jgi:hypothetical protein